MSQETLTRAWEILQDAYQAQMEGAYDRAVELYQSSLELHPTAEAYTFLGWTYHFRGRIEEAIADSEVVVIAKRSPDFTEYLQCVHNDKIVVDLVKALPHRTDLEGGHYEGICW